MPEKLKKLIGLVVLLIAVGGVSFNAMLNTWKATGVAASSELVR